MKNTIKFFTILSLVFTLASCSSDDDNNVAPDPNVVYEAELTGAMEVPANESASKGNAILTFNKETKIFTLKVTHDIATPTAGHVHKGAVGENGDVVFPFESLTSPISYTSPVLTDAQVSDLNNGLYYVNIHTESNPGGEIRGNLMKK